MGYCSLFALGRPGLGSLLEQEVGHRDSPCHYELSGLSPFAREGRFAELEGSVE